MNPISSQQSFFPYSQGAFAGSRSMQAEQTRAGSLSLETATDLTITTAEGDTVTLNLASAMAASVGVYSSEQMADGTRTSTRTVAFDYANRQSMSITVDGELSEEELADIREAVNAIGGMVEDFLAGDLSAMAADGELFKELDTIASLEAAFSYERQVTYGERERVTLSTESRGERPGRRRGHGHGRLHNLMHHIDRLTDKMADRAAEFGERRDHVARSVAGWLRRHGNGPTNDTPADRLNREVVQTVASVFEQKMTTRTESADFVFVYSA